MKTMGVWTLAVAALLGATPLASVAQHRDHDRAWRGDIRHFDRHDHDRWRSGSWRHGSHGGRIGWWWVTGGMWNFYQQPVYPYPYPYPYPDPYRAPTVVIEQAPPPIIVQMPAQPASPGVAPLASPPAAQYWYYCEAAGAYYPYVATCPSGWKTVPATPPGVPQ